MTDLLFFQNFLIYNDHRIFETWNYIYVPVFAVRRDLEVVAWAGMTGLENSPHKERMGFVVIISH